MPIIKESISSPLEAGPSILDAKQLPVQVISALDYVSSRLARKRLHLSLIVVRKDINILPQPPSPQATSPAKRSESPGHSIATSPARSIVFSNASSTITKSLSKSSSSSSLSDSVSSVSASSGSSFSRSKWPGLPASPKAGNSASPPPSPISNQNSYGITLMHVASMTEKAEKILRRTIQKAEKKFSIGSGWLSSKPLTNTITGPATNDLIRRSLTQNEILFSSEGLTLLSLDHVYTFKCQLHTYSRTLSPSDLTSAVDELRRLVLCQNGKRMTKGYLVRAYDWLGVSLAALVDVNEGYKTAYGGKERHGGIEVLNEERQSPPPLKTNFNIKEIRRMRLYTGYGPSAPPSDEELSPGGNSDSSGCRTGDEGIGVVQLVEVGESARGMDSYVRSLKEDRGPHYRGPMTPNGFEDITPVTNGEWKILMVGGAWKEARTAAVETC